MYSDESILMDKTAEVAREVGWAAVNISKNVPYEPANHRPVWLHQPQADAWSSRATVRFL